MYVERENVSADLGIIPFSLKLVLFTLAFTVATVILIIVITVTVQNHIHPADMELYFQSHWTLAHAFFVLFSIIPFIGAAWKTPKALKQLNINSKVISYLSLLIIPAFLMHGALNQGGLVQRATIVIVLFWVSYLSWCLLPAATTHNPPSQIALPLL
jgi:hypothetical protein